jgi:hypothetical protein
VNAVYFQWSLILLGIWGAAYLALPSARRKVLRMSVITAPLGLTEPLFVPRYWSPPTLFDLAQRSGFDLESAIFAFAIGGLAGISYDFFIRSDVRQPRRDDLRHRWHKLALASPLLIVPVLLLVPSVNPIYWACIALSLGAVASVACRPDLLGRTLIGAAVFTGLYFVFFLSLVLAHPDYVPRVWNLPDISGVLVMGVPLEELLFAASLGAMWAGLYEHATWRPAGTAPSTRYASERRPGRP